MATPPVIDNDQLPLATHCLEFTKALVMQGVSFNFSITAGSFAFSFDTSNGIRNSATARSPAVAGKTRKSPSTLKRNARRRELFLKKKSENSLRIPSELTKTTHPQSQAHCPPSADSTDIENIEVQQILGNGDWISHPRSHSPINQLDGISDPCDKVDDSQLNHTNDTNDNHSEILCAMCNLKMTPTHQCCETDKTQPKSNDDRDLLSTRASAEKSCEIIVNCLKKAGFSEEYIENRVARFWDKHGCDGMAWHEWEIIFRR